MKVERLSALNTGGRLYPAGNIPGTHFCWRLTRSQGHSALLKICNIFCFPMMKIVTWTRLNFTLYVHCLFWCDFDRASSL